MPPVLAANYSHSLAALLKENPDIVDAVKVSEFYDPGYVELYRTMPVVKPFILHGLCQDTRVRRVPSAGMEGFRESLNIPSLQAAISLCSPDYLSAHLECHAYEHPEPGAFLERLRDDVDLVRSITELPLHLENTHFDFPRPGRMQNARYMCDPEFIREALALTGCRLLLDVAHAQAAAWHLGLDAEDYIRSLPLHLVDELHVNGPAMVDGELRDRHVELSEEEYSLLDAILGLADVKVVSLEYGGLGPVYESKSDPDALARQLRRLRSIIL
jgi:uncharacterized protein (UPF0276 family)